MGQPISPLYKPNEEEQGQGCWPPKCEQTLSVLTLPICKNHSWFAPIEKSHGHRVSLKSVKEILEYEWAITKIIESSRNCLVRWLKSDDETYLHDGIPLPLPLPLPTY